MQEDHIHVFPAYLHHDLDLGPLSTSAPQKWSPLHVDPVSGVYCGEEGEGEENEEADDVQLSFKSLAIGSEEKISKENEETNATSPALRNIKKKLLTIRSWPNLIRKSSKQ